MEQKACAYTGHRPEKLPFGNDENDPRCKMLKQKIMCETLEMIRNGVTTFIVGMARGVDKLYFKHFDADGIWDEADLEIRYSQITSVCWGTRYAQYWKRYMER